jgi:hypothetical protein
MPREGNSKDAIHSINKPRGILACFGKPFVNIICSKIKIIDFSSIKEFDEIREP